MVLRVARNRRAEAEDGQMTSNTKRPATKIWHGVTFYWCESLQRYVTIPA